MYVCVCVCVYVCAYVCAYVCVCVFVFRAEKSAEASHEQIFKGKCVPEVSDQLQPIFSDSEMLFFLLLQIVRVQGKS